MNSISAYFALIAILLCSLPCVAGSLAISSGYQTSEHQYLDDTSTQKGVMFGAALDFHHWRRKDIGWLARGPAFKISQSPGMLAVSGQLPLYQWHKHQGSWLEIEWRSQELQTQLSDPQIFLGNDGVPVSLTQDSLIGTTRQFQRLQIYWHESTRHENIINLAGFTYSRESSPAISELSSTNANIFEGRFEGSGVMLGRMKDDRGLNFQWRLNVASLDSHFSNDATGHRLLAKQESSVYKVAITLSWHYRYYLSPYWYLAPQVQYRASYLTQSELEPVDVEHSSFLYTHTQSTISLRRHF